LQGSLAVAQKAWDLIPNPKNKWDYYPQSLSSGFVEDYTELRDVDAMRKWIAVTYEMYDDPSHSSTF
jgi:hypothetical protein